MEQKDKLELITRTLREHSVKCSMVGTADMKRVECICCTRAGTLVAIDYIVPPSGNGVTLHTVGLGRLMDNAFRGEMLRTLNGFNRRYKYVRFSMSDDNMISCTYDIPTETEGLEDVVTDIHMCMMDIIDHSIREILSIAISGADDEED